MIIGGIYTPDINTTTVDGATTVKLRTMDTATMVQESVLRGTWPAATTDAVAHVDIVDFSVTGATTGSGALPVETVDYTLNRATGVITWLAAPGVGTQTPTSGTTYTVSYTWVVETHPVCIVDADKSGTGTLTIQVSTTSGFTSDVRRVGYLQAAGPTVNEAILYVVGKAEYVRLVSTGAGSFSNVRIQGFMVSYL